MKRAAAVCCVLLFVVAVVVLVRGPAPPDREAISAGFSTSHWAGTDELGRDRAYRTSMAFVLGLTGATVSATVATGVTLAIAMVAGFTSAPVRALLLYASDICLALPWLFLLMLVRSALPLTLPAGMTAVVSYALLAALGWPMYVRSVTARVETLHGSGWYLHARASGMRWTRVLRVHVFPHLLPISMTQFLLCIPLFLIAEANLGSLGLGVGEPLVSWGSLLGDITSSSQLAATRWVYLPLALLGVTVLSLEVLGADD